MKTSIINGSEVSRLSVAIQVVASANKQPVDKGLDELVKRAEELQNGGLYRRAATLWMDIFKRSKVMTLRERSLKQRQQCLRKVKQAKSQSEWYLAGQFNGGH
ncbi:PerC family transcriptional regulator [Enterobacter kobei]|uniref:PerC family transcriptional regulator n=1 Tax=Enterobacter kobei TaxID=208224 RepID=UPI0032AF4140